MPDATFNVVLLIDDHADTREMYTLALQDAGYLVHHASDGAEAFAQAAMLVPSAVVTDMRLLGQVTGIDIWPEGY